MLLQLARIVNVGFVKLAVVLLATESTEVTEALFSVTSVLSVAK